MPQDLISSAPGVYTALYNLLTAAGAAQNPAVPVFGFELTEWEPGTYVIVNGIENHKFDPESMGTFSQLENYDITGVATVFTGSSVTDDPTVTTDILSQTYAAFQSVVMTPIMSNRMMPILGTTGPTPYQMLPGDARYTGTVGNLAGGPGGWVGTLEWSYHFSAYLTPA